MENKNALCNFGRELLLSLPPMETRDWTSTQSDLRKLNVYSDDTMNERNQKLCVSDGSASSSLSTALRIALHDHQLQYKAKDAVNARYSVCDGQDEKILIRTCAEHLASHNCNAGHWIAEWNLADCSSGTTGTLSGAVGLHVFYYEDGSNVQLRTSREFSSVSVSGSDEAEFTHAIVEQISSWEKEVFEELTSLFDDGEMDSKLRQIRRILPITKTRFKWDAAAQAAVKLLNARAK